VVKEIDSFSLETHEGEYENWPLETRLYFKREDTQTKVPGFAIEAQYQLPIGYLLITSWDCPFEESNNFLLLDSEFSCVAQNELKPYFNTYLLCAHWPISDDAFVLHYASDLFFTLSIQASFLGKRLCLEVVAEDSLTEDMKRSVHEYEKQLEEVRKTFGGRV